MGAIAACHKKRPAQRLVKQLNTLLSQIGENELRVPKRTAGYYFLVFPRFVPIVARYTNVFSQKFTLFGFKSSL
jgi:hypothetical protein